MASIKASSQQTIIQQLYNCYSPEEADKLIKKLDRPLHLFNRKLMVDLIRREILQEYPYEDVIKDYFLIQSPQEKQEFLMVLKYSIKGEFYKQGMEMLIKLANFSKEDYPALESIRQLMEEYIRTSTEDITEFKSQLEELQFIIEGFGNLILNNTSKVPFVNQGRSIAAQNSSKVETVMQMHKTMHQQENEDTVLLNIQLKGGTDMVDSGVEQSNSQDEAPKGQEDGCNEQWWLRTKSQEIELSYQKSRSQPIAIQFINSVLKDMIQGTREGLWTKNFDRLLLKCLSYEIILNNMKFNPSSVQTPLFQTILSHLKEHPGNWKDKVFKVGRDYPYMIDWNHYKTNSAYTSCGLAEYVKNLYNKSGNIYIQINSFQKEIQPFIQELAKQCRIKCIKIIAACVPHYKDKNRLMKEIKALASDPQIEVRLKCQQILVKKKIPIENQEIFMGHLLKSFRTGEQYDTEREFIRAYIRANFRSTYITKDILTDFFRGLQYIIQSQTKGNVELIKTIQKESLTSKNLVDQYISKYIIQNQGLPNDILELIMNVYLTSNHKDAIDMMEDFMYLATNGIFYDRVIYELSKSKQKRVLCFFIKLLFKLSQQQQFFNIQYNEQLFKLLSNEQFIANTGFGHIQFCSQKNPDALQIAVLAAETFIKAKISIFPLFMYLIDKYHTLKEQVRLSLLTSVRTNIQQLKNNGYISIRKLLDLHSNQNNISCRAHLSKAILFNIKKDSVFFSVLQFKHEYQVYDDASIINLFQSRGSQCNYKDLVTDNNKTIIQVLKCQQQPSQKVRGIFILVLASKDFLYLHQKVIRKCEQTLSNCKTLNKDLVSAIERYLLTCLVNQDSLLQTFQNIKNFTTHGLRFSNKFLVDSIRKINNENDRQELLRIYSVETYYEDNIYYLLLQFRVGRNIDNQTFKPYIDTALMAIIKNLDKTEFLYPEFPQIVASSCNEYILYFFADYLLEKHLLIYYKDIETSLLKRIKSTHNSKILQYLTLFLKDGYHLTQQTLKYIRSLPIKYSQQYVTLISYLCLNQNVAILKLNQYCKLIASQVDTFDKSMVVGTLEYYLAKYTDELLDEDKYANLQKCMDQAPKQKDLYRSGQDIANKIKGLFFESSSKQSVSWEQEEEIKKKRINFNESIGNILRNKTLQQGFLDCLHSIVNEKKNQFTNEFYVLLEKLLQHSNEDLLSTVINICIMLAKVDPQFYSRFNSEALFVEIQNLSSSDAFILTKSPVNTKLKQMFTVFDQSGAKQLDSNAWKKFNIYRESTPEDKVKVFKDLSENDQLSKGETIQLIETTKNNEDQSIYMYLLSICQNKQNSEELNTLITEITNVYKIQKFSNHTQQRVIEVFLQKYGKINNQSSRKALLEALIRVLNKNNNIMNVCSKHTNLIIRELMSLLSKKSKLIHFKDLVQNCWMYLGPESTYIHQFIKPIPRQVLADKQMPNEKKVLILQNLIRIRDYNWRDQNLLTLAQQMIKSMCATPAVMRYYRFLVETFISQSQYFEDNLLQSCIYKYLYSKDQNIRIEAVQLLMVLHSESKQIVTGIARLCHQVDETQQPSRMKKLLYKCFLSLCSDMQDKTFCQIGQAIQTALGNKEFPLDINRLKLVSTCSYFVIKTNNVTQLLCNDLYYRVMKDLSYPDLQGFKILFFQSCRHLISSQDIMLSSMQKAAAFIQEIHRLIDTENLIFEDLIQILNYSKLVGVQRVTIELGLYSSQILDVIVYKYAQSKSRKLCVWELQALRMSLGLTKTIGLLLSQTQQKQMPSIVTYFSKLKEKGEQLQKVKFVNSKVDYRVQAITQLSIQKIGKESSVKLVSQLINLFTKVSFKMHFSVYDSLPQQLTKQKVQQLTQTLIGIVQYRLEDSKFQATLQLQHVDRLQKLNQLFLHRTPAQEARSQQQTLEQFIKLNISKTHTQKIASSLKNTFKECRRSNINQSQETKLTSPQSSNLANSMSRLRKSKQSDQLQQERGFLLLYLRTLAKIKKVHLRPSQITAIWTALLTLKSKGKTGKGSILQVGTGEGKSLIIAGLATILVHKGYLVDIVTSSPVLAERDSANNQNLYKQMDITCASNIDSANIYKQGVKECYDSQIVYGDITQFEFDWLRHEFQNLGTRSSRYKNSQVILLIDEADNIMVDNMFYIARLADSFPGIQSLQPFYFFIWNNFQSALTKLLKIDGKWYWVKGNVLVKQGKIHIHYIGQIQDQNESGQQQKNFENIENILIQQKRNSKPISDLPFIQCQIKQTSCRAIMRQYLQNVAEEMLSKSEFMWSQSAKAHAQVSIDRWVDSIIAAYVMEEDVNYIVSESGSIKPVDFANTGVIQSNTSLSYGTHQFLEVKHSCRMTLETRTTNFISNYSFIKQYKANIVGLTGTIGGQSTEVILDKVYGCDSYYIPRYMKEALHRLPTIAVPTSEEWINQIAEKAVIETLKKRGVLIICLSIKITQLVRQRIVKKSFAQSKIKMYTSNEDESSEKVKECQSGQIIIATNLAGRGTDIKTDQIQKFGGLHIILTYLPESKRIQQQAEGRTARKGKRGSVQLILQNTNITVDLEKQRDSQEKACAEEIIQEDIQLLQNRQQLFGVYMGWLKQSKQKQLKNKKLYGHYFLEETQDRFSQIMSEHDYKLEANKLKEKQKSQRKLYANKIYIQTLNKIKELRNQMKKGLDDFQKLLNKPYSISKQTLKECFLRNGCYFSQLAFKHTQGYLRSRSGSMKQVAEKLLQAAKLFNPNDFNPYYMNAYYILNGQHNWLSQNDHKVGYKQQAAKQLEKAKQLLLNEMSGYEGILIYLGNKDKTTSKLFRQIQTRLNEILKKCLDSIEALQELLKGSSHPISLSYKNDTGIIVRHIRIDRKKIEQNLNLLTKDTVIELHSLAQKDLSSVSDIFFSTTNTKQKFFEIKGSAKSVQTVLKGLYNKKSLDDVPLRIKITGINAEMAKRCYKHIQLHKSSVKFLFSRQSLQHQKDPQSGKSLLELFHQTGNKELIQNICQVQGEFKASIQGNQKKKINKCFSLFEIHKNIEKFLEIIPLNLIFKIIFYTKSRIRPQFFEELQQNQMQCQILDPKLLSKQNYVISRMKAEEYADCCLNKNVEWNIVIQFRKDELSKLSQAIKKYNQKMGQYKKDINISKRTKLEEMYNKYSRPDKQIALMYNRGFYYIYSAQNKKAIPWGAIATLAGVAVTQIVVGSALVLTGAGATVGVAILSESINEIFQIANVFCTREFDFKGYLLEKAASLALSAITMGWCPLKNVGQGAMLAKSVLVEAGQIGFRKVGFKLIGKKLLIELGKQLASRTVFGIMDKMIELVTRLFREKFASAIKESIRSMPHLETQLKIFRYVQKQQRSRGGVATNAQIQQKKFSLQQQIQAALYPPPTVNPYVKKVVDLVWKRISGVVGKMIEKTKYKSVLQIAQITQALRLMLIGLQTQVYTLILLIQRKLKNTTFPQLTIKRYIQKRVAKKEQRQSILQTFYKNEKSKEDDIRKYEQSINNAGMKILNCLMGQTNVQQFKLLINSNGLEKCKIQDKLYSLLALDCKKIGEEDLQIVQKILTDFIQDKIHSSYSGIITPIACRYTANLVGNYLEVNLANIADHREQETINYVNIKQRQLDGIATEQDLIFLNDYEKPEVSKQLEAFGRYQALSLANNYKEIQKEIQERYTQNIEGQINQRIQKKKKENQDAINQNEFMIIANELGKKIKITRNPTQILSPAEINQGIELVLYEEGNFGPQGQNIGHYVLWNRNSGIFDDVQQQSKTSCGLDVLRKIQSQSGNTVTNNQLKQKLWSGMKKYAVTFLEREKVDNWLCSQFPEHANALVLKGGVDQNRATEVENNYQQPQNFYYNLKAVQFVQQLYRENIPEEIDRIANRLQKQANQSELGYSCRISSIFRQMKLKPNPQMTLGNLDNHTLCSLKRAQIIRQITSYKIQSALKEQAESDLRNNPNCVRNQPIYFQNNGIDHRNAQLTKSWARQAKLVNGPMNQKFKKITKVVKRVLVSKMLANKNLPLAKVGSQYRNLLHNMYNGVCRHQNVALAQKYLQNRVLERGDLLHLVGVIGRINNNTAGHRVVIIQNQDRNYILKDATWKLFEKRAFRTMQEAMEPYRRGGYQIQHIRVQTTYNYYDQNKI